MGDVFRKVDDLQFDAFPGFQKIANWTEYYLHIPTTRLALLVFIVAHAYYGAFRLHEAVYEGKSENWMRLTLLGISVLLVIYFYQRHSEVYKHGMRNILRSLSLVLFFRISFTLFCILDVVIIVLGGNPSLHETVRDVGIWISYYLLCCDSLPPGDRFWDKFRKQQFT